VIDTHAHLDSCAEPASVVLERARVVGVDRVVSIGSGIESCRHTLAIADEEPGAFAALGIHPHQAGDANDRDLETLRLLFEHPRAVAVGETGLDYYRDRSPRPRQQEVFRAQAELAQTLDKALVVHTRAADDDTLTMLGHVDPPAVILHCFSSVAMLPAALERGYYISFAGNVTYPKAVELRLAATQVPADRLLAETDSPFLAPQEVRGRTNEPAHVIHVVRALAHARGEDPAALARQIDENADRAFALA
jgi:TatD DNase family protein